MKKILLSLFLLLPVNSFGYEILYPENLTASTLTESIETKHEIDPNDQEIKSLVWNRFVNKNFVVLSIDETQGAWLYKNIDSINNWCTNRWGFPKIDFSTECRIFCVPNKLLLKKLFGLEGSKIEIRKKDDATDIIVMWLSLDESSIPAAMAPYMTRASFFEYEKKEQIVLPWWFLRSAEILSSPIIEIRKRTNEFMNFDLNDLNVNFIFGTSFVDYQKLSKEEKDSFDQQCLILSLMLRKELGEVKLHSLLRLEEKNKIEDVLSFVYGFKSIEEFESKFLLYCKDLSKELSLEKVPNSYLEITSKRK